MIVGTAVHAAADTARPTGPVEVVQVVQTPAHSVPLVASRAAWARVYVQTNRRGAMLLRGRLRVRSAGRADTMLDVAAPAKLSPAKSGQAGSKRGQWDGALNFLLPASLMRPGALELSLGAVFTPTGDAVVCAECDAATRTVVVRQAALLQVKAVGFRYKTETGTISPRPVDFEALAAWLRRAYPVTKVTVERVTVDAPASLDCASLNTLVARLRALDLKGGQDPRTHYYGMLHDGGRDDLSIRGCSNGIPLRPDPSVVASGPTGEPRGNYAWDRDSSYGDWYGGHEIAHTLGLRHPGWCNQAVADPVARKRYPGGAISNSKEQGLGLDWDGASPPVLLGGTTAYDVMTYCRSVWVSAYTDSLLLERVYAEEAEYRKGYWTPGSADGPLLNVIARFNNLTLPAGQIENVFSVPFRGRTPATDSAMFAAAPPSYRVQIRLSGGGAVLAVADAVIQPDEIDDPEAPPGQPQRRGGTVNAYLYDLPGLALIEVLRGGSVVASRRVTSLPPQRVGAPAVRVFPESYEFRWSAVDPDPSVEGITYYLQVMREPANGWSTVDETQYRAFTVSRADVRAAPRFRIRVIASDGKNDAVILTSCDLAAPPRPGAPGAGDVCPRPGG